MQVTSDNQKDWPNFLQALTFAYNVTIHSVTNVTPFEVVFGHLPRIPLDNLKERNEFIDPTRPARPTFKEGDLVLVERPTHVKEASIKLTYTYLGPYRIAKKLSDVSYAVANVRGRSGTSVIHAWHLRAFIARDGDVASNEVEPTFIPREAVDEACAVDQDEASSLIGQASLVDNTESDDDFGPPILTPHSSVDVHDQL